MTCYFRTLMICLRYKIYRMLRYKKSSQASFVQQKEYNACKRLLADVSDHVRALTK